MLCRVSSHAKSIYAGKRGRAIKFSSGRKHEWTIGIKYAKFVCLVFNTGIFAGREMWYKINELDF